VAGLGVQLTAVALLVHVASMHPVLATAIAVELAVLHNFAWHERWTWRDRGARSARERVRQFWRFQAVNGVVSLVGNIVVAAALARGLGMEPVAANLVGILLCSLVNFAAGERLVFVSAAPAIVVAAMLTAPLDAAAGPRPGTVLAWEAYERTVDGRYNTTPTSGGAFFAQDLDQATRGSWRERVQRGEITAIRIDGPATPDGRIHHWAGAVFVPDTTVERIVERLKQQAGREDEVYKDVLDSRLLSRDGDRLRVYMKLQRTTIITATFDTEHAVEYRRVGPGRASSRSVAVRIAELDDAGTPREREKAPGDDNGFLWKLNAYWRFEQVNGGVILECESVSLSRGVPTLLRPVAGPIIDRVAREALENTLRAMRGFLTGQGPEALIRRG
jgi:putative flippase GtrA